MSATSESRAVTFGSHRLKTVLGRGGMGEVFLAERVHDGRVLALKILPQDQVGNPMARARLQREAGIHAALQHPHIVAVRTIGEVDGRPFFGMDRIEGGSLADVLARLTGIAPAALHGDALASALQAVLGDDTAGAELQAADHVRACMRCLLPIAEALAYAHARGVVHRDVKPENILLRREGTPLLTDFGLAHAPGVDTPVQARDLGGTPHYLAPEQLDGGTADPRSDVFALGVTLYELVVGCRPFDGPDPDTVLQRIRRARPPDPRAFGLRLPEDLLAVLEQALQKRPADRYPDMAAFARDLAALRDGIPVQARRAGAARRALRYARRQPLAAAFALVLAVALPLLLWFGDTFTHRPVADGAPAVPEPGGRFVDATSGRAPTAADTVIARSLAFAQDCLQRQDADLEQARLALDTATALAITPQAELLFWRGVLLQRTGQDAATVRAVFEQSRTATDSTPALRARVDAELARLPR